MSIERELLKKWVNECQWRGSNMILLEETKALLDQPEQDLREDLREGISLRDHFAGLAMQGLLNGNDMYSAATKAYYMADAMMAERSKRDD